VVPQLPARRLGDLVASERLVLFFGLACLERDLALGLGDVVAVLVQTEEIG
jgi:hypothetical protein